MACIKAEMVIELTMFVRGISLANGIQSGWGGRKAQGRLFKAAGSFNILDGGWFCNEEDAQEIQRFYAR